jgi:hypothetical protein
VPAPRVAEGDRRVLEAVFLAVVFLSLAREEVLVALRLVVFLPARDRPVVCLGLLRAARLEAVAFFDVVFLRAPEVVFFADTDAPDLRPLGFFAALMGAAR